MNATLIGALASVATVALVALAGHAGTIATELRRLRTLADRQEDRALADRSHVDRLIRDVEADR